MSTELVAVAFSVVNGLRVLIRDELASGGLVQLLPDYSFAEPSLLALYARDRYRPTRLRALVTHVIAG